MSNNYIKILKDPLRICRGIGYWLLNLFAKVLSDKLYLKCKWFIRTGHKLNLDNPQTFNEKLQWLKLYDRKPEYTVMVDKFEAKKYVASIIGEKHIIPTIAIYDRPEDIDFDVLPEKFVLKCTHDSGGIVICHDKSQFDKDKAIKKLRKGLRSNFYLYNREWPYKNVKPRIIAEQYMTDGNGELRDYKFFCFNGNPNFFKVDFGRFVEHHANYYSFDGELLPFEEKRIPRVHDVVISMPSNLEEMIMIAKRLSKNYPFVRVDMYNVKNHIYFGEITFFPDSGFGRINPEEWDYKLGEMITLPIKSK